MLKRLVICSESEWEQSELRTCPTYRVINVDFAHSGTLYFALNRVAAAANAPHWYGRNMDAFDELINDRPVGTDVFVIGNFQALNRADREQFMELVGSRFDEQQGKGFAHFVIIEAGK